MNYDLCKKLKDAGFPQTTPNGNYKNGHYIVDGKEPCYDPTLSELIKECKEGFRTLILHTQYTRKLKQPWEAVPNKKLRLECKSKKGESPEEAVAYLWLELNK
jgi:hypothetical protein